MSEKQMQTLALMAASIYAGFCAHEDNPLTDANKHLAQLAAIKAARQIWYKVLRGEHE